MVLPVRVLTKLQSICVRGVLSERSRDFVTEEEWRAGVSGQAYICTIRREFVSIHDASESWDLHGLLVVVGDVL